jgi:hypothetical protein
MGSTFEASLSFWLTSVLLIWCAGEPELLL